MISTFLYLLLFAFCFVLDYGKLSKSLKLRRFFLFVIYVFLCFGYMTGSDWRDYELDFNDLNSFSSPRGGSPFEVGFWSVFYFLKLVFHDFFLVIGLLKVLYLHTTIIVLKKLTDKWLSSLAILMPLSLCFMLIDNPLRYMVSLILINVALLNIINEKKLIAICSILVAFFFHNTCVLFLILLPFLKKFEVIINIKSFYIFIAYIIVLYLFSSDSFIGPLLEEFQSRMLLLGGKNYQSYTDTHSEAFFTLGSFMNIIMMLLLLILRKTIIKEPRGKLLFVGSVVYYFLFRLLIFIPTGFRIAVPFTYFVASAFATCIKTNARKIYKTIIIVFFAMLFFKKIWSGYSYIPYSNSIPYIITKHKPFAEREMYNLKKYEERTGRNWGD